MLTKSSTQFAEDLTESKSDLQMRMLRNSISKLHGFDLKAAGTRNQHTYNPWEVPVEDRAMMELCSRLRLVNTGQKTICVVSEDPKFIAKLRDLIDKASLPFFCIVNEIAVLFEVGKEAAEKAGSVQKLVFGSIRKHPALRNFLVNVISDMRVVISTYDSDVEESMEWQEMLAYLSDNRNPFVTVQLLPRYVHPERGMVKYIPDDMIPRYDPRLHLQDTDVGKMELDPLDEEDLVEEEGEPHIQKGPPDIDGGSHPTWDKTFCIKFKPPKLTNCPVMFTDILLLSIDHCKKYVIVMVRVAEDKSLFMTAYDPRTATEYMLFGGPVSWCLPDIANDESDVFKKAFKDEFNDQKDSRLDFFQKQLEQAIARHDDPNAAPEDKFRLGFAITPRLLVRVYNQQGPTTDELLGSCQVSISSVLSGTGNNTTVWTTLMHETQGLSGGQSFDKAGALNLQLGYLKQKEIDVLLEKNKRKGKSTSLDSKSLISVSRAPSVMKSTSRDKGDHEDGSLYPARVRVDLVKAEKLKLEQEVAELEQRKKALLSADMESSKHTRKTKDIPSDESNPSVKQAPTNIQASVASERVSGANGVAALVSSILDILVARQKSYGNSSSKLISTDVVLRPLVRAAKALQYEGINTMTAQIVFDLFCDLLITVTEEDAEVSSVVTCLVLSCCFGSCVSQALVNAAAGKMDGTVHSEVFIKFFTIEMKKLFTCCDEGEKLEAQTFVEKPAENEVQKEEESVNSEAANPVSPAASVVNVAAINWDTYELPENWSRKKDKKTGKVLCIMYICVPS
jgi:hypothetical protein